MSYSHPAPPQELPDYVIETLEECSPELLQHVAHYAEELAEYHEREARLAEETDEEAIEERPKGLPDDVHHQSNNHNKGNQGQPLLLLAVARR